jgi:hypothetical protein
MAILSSLKAVSLMTLATLTQAAVLPATEGSVGARVTVSVSPAYTVVGCYREPPRSQGRVLDDKNTGDDAMTTATCAAFCSDFKYFGTEYGRECWCGNDINANAAAAESVTECDKPCAGAASELCGAGDRINVYQNGAFSGPPTVATVYQADYEGCAIDSASDRLFKGAAHSSDDMTPAVCANFCQDFAYFGVEVS